MDQVLSPADMAAPDIDEDPHAYNLSNVVPHRVLLIATIFDMPYRVMRCAEAAGSEVYVLGSAGALAMRFSRRCRRFILSDCIIHGGRDQALALEINCLVHELGINTVMSGDAPSTRALIATRDLIEAQCFPLPSLETFDLLNDKWAFAQICKDVGILHPTTRLLPDAAALAAEIAKGNADYPMIAKPLGRSGSGGVVILDGVDTDRRLTTINYRPVLVQKFIAGEDIGASVYARAGKIEAFVAHRFWHQVYSTFRDDKIYGCIAALVSHFNLDGVYNFDMRLAPDGAVYYLECNPRFFFKINLSMVAGINFVAYGLRGARNPGPDFILAGARVRMPKALLFSLLTSARCTKRDWAMAYYLYSDPVPYLMERLKMTV